MEKEMKAEDKIHIIAITDVELPSLIKGCCLFRMMNFMGKWIPVTL